MPGGACSCGGGPADIGSGADVSTFSSFFSALSDLTLSDDDFIE